MQVVANWTISESPPLRNPPKAFVTVHVPRGAQMSTVFGLLPFVVSLTKSITFVVPVEQVDGSGTSVGREAGGLEKELGAAEAAVL